MRGTWTGVMRVTGEGLQGVLQAGLLDVHARAIWPTGH